MLNCKAKFLFFILIVLIYFTGCVPEEGVEDDWAVESPDDHGLSTNALENAAAQIGTVETRYGVVFVKDGVIVYEEYFNGNRYSKYDAYSVTKSFSSALMGVAITEGLGISVDDKISAYTSIPTDWQGKPVMSVDATIEHVLSQTSHTDPPGEEFFYQAEDNTKILPTLSKVINQALMNNNTGMTTAAFKDTYLLTPLGLVNTDWQETEDGNVKIASGIKTTCRDIAKLGLLYLNMGMWKGERIIDAQYILDSTTAPFPDANTAYGYLWWLNPSIAETRSWVRPKSAGTTGTGAMVQGAPDNVYFAMGYYGQLVIVIPDYNMVVTTMGYTDVTDSLDTLQAVWNAINGNLNLYNIGE